MTAATDGRASSRTIVLRIVGVIAVVSVVVGVVLYTQLAKPRSREDHVRMGMQCLLRADGIPRDAIARTLRATAESLRAEPKWPRACAGAFERGGERAVQAAIESGDLAKIEAAIAPLAK